MGSPVCFHHCLITIVVATLALRIRLRKPTSAPEVKKNKHLIMIPPQKAVLIPISALEASYSSSATHRKGVPGLEGFEKTFPWR